ncbi:MAG: DUF3105 domain-containing protein [Nitrospirota bacterium]
MEKKTIHSEERLKKILTGMIIAAGIGLLAFLVISSPDNQDRGMGGDPSMATSDKKENKKSPSDGKDLSSIKEIQFFSDEGQTHVPEGTRVQYKTSPPTSGFHYGKWLTPAVYEDKDAMPELVVHSLEHGNAVIYFDREKLAKSDVEALTALPAKHTGQWDGVVVIARSGMESPLILTAWRAILKAPAYDEKKVSAFLDAFLGRGPENPVR